MPKKAYAIVVLGDLLVFLLFIIIGRTNHKAPLSLLDVIKGVAPFALAWFVLSPWLGAYRAATFSSLQKVWVRILPVWLLCGAVGLVLRSWWYDRPFILSFIAVALGFQAVALVIWRLGFLLALRRWPLQKE